MKVEIENVLEFISWMLAALGGWALVVIGLTTLLTTIFVKRTLQREAAVLSEKLTYIGHEFKLRESSYEKYLDLLLDYYSMFYRHYRLCQNATNQDAHRFDDGTIVKTRDVFFEQLDNYVSELKAQEGKLRLVLPPHLLEFHEESIVAFNQFKDVMKRDNYDESFQTARRETFAKIITVTDKLEGGLRDFLRTERLIS